MRMDYNITYISADKLSVIWVKSQRPFRASWAKEIADNFDPDLFEPIIVTKPNGAGIYHIIEGQHRKSAAEQALGQGQQLPCHVIDNADPARAAKIWLHINKTGRKPVRPITTFLVAVEAKEEAEVAINTVVRRCGYFVAEAGKKDNCITAVGALHRVYRLGGASVLQHTLEACRLLWGPDPHGAASPMIAGLGLLMNEFHDKIESRRLRSTVTAKYTSPWKLIDAATAHKEKTSETLEVALADLVRITYNKSLPDNKRLKRRES